MTDESPLDADLRKGREAARILAEPIVIEAFAKIEQEYIDLWKTCTNPEQRDRLWLALQVAGKVHTHLTRVAGGGRIAQHELDELAKLGTPKKRFGIV